MDTLALDIETEPKEGYPAEYALQPWRYLEQSAQISCISVARNNGEALLRTNNYRELLHGLRGMTIYGWNLVFDVAWLIAMGYWPEIKAINWVDTMILWKWIDNSQKKEFYNRGWALTDGAKRWCKDEPWLSSFLAMKQQGEVGKDSKYWETRAKLDAIVTAKISEACEEYFCANHLAKSRHSAAIEAATIPEVARSWLLGVNIDYGLIESIMPTVTQEMMEIEFRLGVSNFSGEQANVVLRDVTRWSPSKVLRSPKQLSELLYTKWKLEPKYFSEKTGAPSTDKTALTYLADENESVTSILRWRELNTQLTKYLQGPIKSANYLNSSTAHPTPRIFSTYTGRFTYASKTSQKFPTGIALHQWPRNKAFRALILPPEGYKHVEFDAASQESRIIAHQSTDENMCHVFLENMKLHAFTGARIAGLSYEDFILGMKADNKAITGPHGLYYQGKFTNLSNNYRIGVKKLMVQAYVQYGMRVDFITAKRWQEAFFRSFPKIAIYWKRAINDGRANGYAESLSGRRFYVSEWQKDSRWGTESSCIMHPVQGTGADMKNLGMRELAIHYPEFIFAFDLHDGLHYWVEQAVPNSRLLEAKELLNNIDYKKEWDVDLKVPFTWDVSVGERWSTLEEL